MLMHKGHRLYIVPRNLTRSYYCGYVEVLPDDYYFGHWNLAEQELDAPGGITYTPAYGKLDNLPKDSEFIGFDTLHNGMENFTESQTIDAYVDLINEIEEKSDVK